MNIGGNRRVDWINTGNGSFKNMKGGENVLGDICVGEGINYN